MLSVLSSVFTHIANFATALALAFSLSLTHKHTKHFVNPLQNESPVSIHHDHVDVVEDIYKIKMAAAARETSPAHLSYSVDEDYFTRAAKIMQEKDIQSCCQAWIESVLKPGSTAICGK